jgi:arginyl-tRNA synthetase
MLFPRQLIINMLLEAIACISSSISLKIPNQNWQQLSIPLKFCHPRYECDYTSALPYELSSYLEKPPHEIAQILYSHIPSHPELAIAITAEGMFNFTLAPTYIQECLEALLIKDLDLGFMPTPYNFPLYTHTQYAYARCCAILRLAEERSILKLANGYTKKSKSLQINLLAIAESLPQLPSSSSNSQIISSQIIRQCQHLTTLFLEFYNHTPTLEIINEASHLLSIHGTKKLIYTLAAGYIVLPSYL